MRIGTIRSVFGLVSPSPEVICHIVFRDVGDIGRFTFQKALANHPLTKLYPFLHEFLALICIAANKFQVLVLLIIIVEEKHSPLLSIEVLDNMGNEIIRKVRKVILVFPDQVRKLR
jgi:hypothetical protein